MKRLVEYFAERSLLVNMISLALFIAGIMFLFSAQREAFPNVDFDWVLVTTVYPGATARDVEKHITKPIEDEIREVDGLKQVYGSSIDSRSVLAIQLDPDLDNKDKTITDIKNAVDRVSDFPDDAEDPEVTELNTKQHPIIEISLFNNKDTKNDSEEFELRRYAKMLEDRLLEVDGTAKITKTGYRDREMIVEVKPNLLDAYHVAINEVIVALSRKSLDFPGGVIKSKNGEILIRTVGEVQNTKEIERVLIRANDMGNWVTIGDVARVKDSFEEEKQINRTRGKKSITLTVIKKESADIITIVENLMKELDKFKKVLPGDYSISYFNDLSYYVKRRLNVLVNNGIVGFMMVVTSLFVTLGWRIAIVTALGIPLAFFGTFTWMAWYGMSINLMSMFGLIMVLGMIVDDAIIVAENIYRHIEMGEPVMKAVSVGTNEVIVPVAGTIMTTIAAFSPLIFMSGIMGKFMWTLPAVVIVALVSSWLECMFILPSHIKDVERGGNRHIERHVKRKDGGIFSFFKNSYRSVITKIINNRYKVFALITLFFFGTILFGIKNVKFILFPQGNIEIVVAKAEAPTSTTVYEMSKKLVKIEQAVASLSDKELDMFTSTAGLIQDEPNDPNTKRGSNYGMVKIFLTPAQSREREAAEIIDEVREKCKSFLKEFEKLEFHMIRTGPPVGKAINVTIKGDDFTSLQKISKEYEEFLLTVKGLKDVKDDFEEGKDELRVIVDEKTAAIAGITVFDVASTVRSCYEGTVATSIKKTDEEIDIRVVFPEVLKNSVVSLNKIKVANKMGNLIPLSRIARLDKTKGLTRIGRKDFRRVINVTADIDEHARGVTSVAVNRELMKKFQDIEERYPGYTVSYEGEFKDTQESIENLARSFIIAFLVIYIILVSIFRSLIHPIMIMSVIPLTLVGVIWTFYFHGLPLSFLALMGVVGLTGVVVNDSIVLVDFIRKKRMEGLSPFDATVEAGVMRLRPIFLTTITTFFGLIPTAYGIGGYDPFLKPMAVSLSWGLIFGTMITLIGTPLLYNIFYDLRKLLFHKEYDEKPKVSLAGAAIEEAKDEIEHKVRDDIVADLRDQICQEVESTVRRQLFEEYSRFVKDKSRRKKQDADRKKN